MNIFLLRQPIFKNDPKSLIISFFVGNFWPRGFADAVLGKAYLLKSWGKWFQWNISIKIKIFIPLNLIANDNVFEWYPKIFFIYFCTYSRAFALCCAQYLIIRYWPKRLCQRPENFEWKVCKNIDRSVFSKVLVRSKKYWMTRYKEMPTNNGILSHVFLKYDVWSARIANFDNDFHHLYL